jgi:hypothetical protein
MKRWFASSKEPKAPWRVMVTSPGLASTGILAVIRLPEFRKKLVGTPSTKTLRTSLSQLPLSLKVS